MLLLPSGACLALELCAGAVNFRLDCAQRRVFIDTFTYAVLLRGNLKFLRAQRYFAGSVYLGLGAATALTGTGKK